MDTETLKQFCTKNLNEYEILFLTYAKDLGLAPNLLHTLVKHIDSQKQYKINGLIWKYDRIFNSQSAYFENELYIILEPYLVFLQQTLDENIAPNNSYDSLTYPTLGPGITSGIQFGNTSISYSTGTTTAYTTDYYTKHEIDDNIQAALSQNHLNSKFSDDINAISLDNFFTNYQTQDNKPFVTTYIKPKFQIVLTH